jgi:hypothetical protein
MLLGNKKNVFLSIGTRIDEVLIKTIPSEANGTEW